MQRIPINKREKDQTCRSLQCIGHTAWRERTLNVSVILTKLLQRNLFTNVSFKVLDSCRLYYGALDCVRIRAWVHIILRLLAPK